MKQKYFRFPECFWEAAQNMSRREKTAFYEAVLNYVFGGGLPVLPEFVEGCFYLVRPYLDNEKKRIEKG